MAHLSHVGYVEGQWTPTLRSAPLLRQQVVEGLEMKIPELHGIEAQKPQKKAHVEHVPDEADLGVMECIQSNYSWITIWLFNIAMENPL